MFQSCECFFRVLANNYELIIIICFRQICKRFVPGFSFRLSYSRIYVNFQYAMFSPLPLFYTLNSGGNCSVLSLTNKSLNRDEHRLLCREPSQGTEPRRLSRYSSGGDDLFSESMSILHKLTGADPRLHCSRELPWKKKKPLQLVKLNYQNL